MINIFLTMKKGYLFGIAALSVLLLAGCGTKELTPTEYCEQNGGISAEWICLFEDGSYCEEESYSKGECKAGEIIYNTVEEEVAVEEENAEEVVAEEENVEEVVAEEENVEEIVVEENAEEEVAEENVAEEVAE